MPGQGKHSAKWDDCFKKVQAQGKEASSAAAICTASVGESARWMQEGDTFLYVDPQTFKLEEVTKSEVPYGEKIANLTEVAEYIVSEVERRKDVSPKEGEHEYGDVEFADPTNKKYPIDTEEHIRAAWNYIHKEKNAGKYSGGDASSIKAKIAAAWKKKIDPKGPPSADEGSQEALTTSEMPMAMQAGPNVSHSHMHKHKDGQTHDHEHPHDAAHSFDNMPAHDHLHMEEEPDTQDMGEPEEKKKGKESIRTTYFSDIISLKEALVDEGAKTVEVTLLRPGWSGNGKYYSRETIGRAAPVFEGAKAYINHPRLSEEKDRPERDVRDVAGYYTRVRQADDGSLRGQLKLLGRNGDEMWPLIVEASKNKPDLIGVSINALGKTKMGEAEGKHGILVEDFVPAKATSTDIVTTPAAGGRFERLMAADDGFTSDLLQHMEFEEWREARPDFVARIQKEMRTARKEDLESNALKEAETLKATVTELREAKSRAEKELSDLRASIALRESEQTADRKLTESKLPKEWREHVKPQLLGKSADEMDRVLEAEKKKFFALKLPVPVKGATAEPLTHAVHPELQAVSEALGVDPNKAPLEGESPEQWAARVNKPIRR